MPSRFAARQPSHQEESGGASRAGGGAASRSVTYADAAVVSVIGLAVLAVFARMFYGVDFTDESFYAALAYKLALGARPLVDEFDTHQLAAWLLQLYARAYLAVVGSSTGFVLGLRAAFFTLTFGFSAAYFTLLRSLLRLATGAHSCISCGRDDSLLHPGA